MAKEVCKTFSVMAKMLSKILSGKKYPSGGGKQKGSKERLTKKEVRERWHASEETWWWWWSATYSKRNQEYGERQTQLIHHASTVIFHKNTCISVHGMTKMKNFNFTSSVQGTMKMIIHHHQQLQCIHHIRCTEVLMRHGIITYLSHHPSLHQFQLQVAHSGTHSQLLPSNHPQLPFLPSQLCCHNNCSCSNIGRSLVLFKISKFIIFQF